MRSGSPKRASRGPFGVPSTIQSLFFKFWLCFQTVSTHQLASRSHAKQQSPSTSGSSLRQRRAAFIPCRLNPGRGTNMEGSQQIAAGVSVESQPPSSHPPPPPSRPLQGHDCERTAPPGSSMMPDARIMGLSDGFWAALATPRRSEKTPTCAMILGRSALDPSRQILTNPRFSSSTASLLQPEEGFTRAATLTNQVAHES
jgi:hypothetical protein